MSKGKTQSHIGYAQNLLSEFLLTGPEESTTYREGDERQTDVDGKARMVYKISGYKARQIRVEQYTGDNVPGHVGKSYFCSELSEYESSENNDPDNEDRLYTICPFSCLSRSLGQPLYVTKIPRCALWDSSLREQHAETLVS